MNRLNFREQIVDELGRKIVSGTFAIGETLRPETELAEQFGVSRPVIREAIKGLAARGLIVSRAKVGTKVAPYQQWKLIDPSVIIWMTETQPASPQFHLQLAELRLMMEPAIAEYVAQYASVEDRHRIGQAFDVLQRSFGNEALWLEADNAFHMAIFSATKNDLMLSIVRSLEPAMLHSIRWTIQLIQRIKRPESVEVYEAMTQESLDRHQAVWLAIRDHQPSDARQATTLLLRGVVNLLQYIVAT